MNIINFWELFQLLAQWSGWMPIVILMIIIIGFEVRYYQNRLQIQTEKYSLLEQKYQEAKGQTSIVLAQKLTETRRKLEGEIET